MKKSDGFTLIELLAVIVLLAILMVIAVPKILNVIENSKKSSAESSIKLVKDAIKTQITSSNITKNVFISDDDGCYLFNFDDQENGNAKELELKNKEKITGTIKYCNGTFSDDTLVFNDIKTTDVTKGLREKVQELYKEELKNSKNYYILYYMEDNPHAILVLYDDNYKFQLRILDDTSVNPVPYYSLHLINDTEKFEICENITLNSTQKQCTVKKNSYRYFIKGYQLLDNNDNFYIELSKYPENIDDYSAYKKYFGKVISSPTNIKITDVLKLPGNYNNTNCTNYIGLTYNSNSQFYCFTNNSNVSYNTSLKGFNFNYNNSHIYRFKYNGNWDITFDMDLSWNNLVNNQYKNNNILDIMTFSTFDIKDENGNVVYKANTTLENLID